MEGGRGEGVRRERGRSDEGEKVRERGGRDGEGGSEEGEREE